MPWEVKAEGGKFCTFNKETGRKVSCFSSKEKAEAHVKALYANAPESRKAEEDTNGLTLLRIAYTNEPHLRLRNHPISVVQIDGQDYVRHPVMVAAKYRHPNGTLDLNGTQITDPKHKFNRIIANHYAKVQDAGVYTRPGHKSDKAWTWVSPEHGGWLSYEESGGDQLLVAYGRPTRNEYLEAIRSGDYQYVSADLHLKYKSNVMLEDGEQDGNVVSWESLEFEEGSMGTVTITQEEYDGLLAKATALESAQAKLEEAKSSASEHETKIKMLEEKLTTAEIKLEPEIPETLRLKLEENERQLNEYKQEVVKARQRGLVDRFKGAVKLATTPDRQGNIVDAFTLEFAKSLVFEKEIGSGEDVIKLENKETADGLQEHYIKAMTYFLENTPRSLRGQGQSLGEERKLEDAISDEDLAEVDQMIKDAWGG